MAKNHYETLGVDKKATQDEIRTAYRKLARQYHPDLHPNDEECARKFKEINEANEILSDPEKRKQYDFELENPGRSAFGGFGGGQASGFGGFSDIFSDIFSAFGGGGGRAESYDKTGKDIINIQSHTIEIIIVGIPNKIATVSPAIRPKFEDLFNIYFLQFPVISPLNSIISSSPYHYNFKPGIPVKTGDVQDYVLHVLSCLKFS